eukprot:jgi/Hompol1/450/HPOL_004731-RA
MDRDFDDIRKLINDTGSEVETNLGTEVSTSGWDNSLAEKVMVNMVQKAPGLFASLPAQHQLFIHQHYPELVDKYHAYLLRHPEAQSQGSVSPISPPSSSSSHKLQYRRTVPSGPSGPGASLSSPSSSSPSSSLRAGDIGIQALNNQQRRHAPPTLG